MIPSYLYKVSFPTGSNYICNPPVTNTDVDEMFLVDDLQEVNFQLTGLGWTKCGLEEETYQDKPSHWASYRKENMNALLTTDLKYFMDFFKATEEAKHLNLLNKEDRVALFQKILGEEPKIKKHTRQHAKPLLVVLLLVVRHLSNPNLGVSFSS